MPGGLPVDANRAAGTTISTESRRNLIERFTRAIGADPVFGHRDRIGSFVRVRSWEGKTRWRSPGTSNASSMK